MVLSSAVRWWDEWQLRVLVLASLGVQYFLAIFGGRRKSRIPPWYRFFIWLSYLGSDALAIYALATLFNRKKKTQYINGNRDLEVLWAPLLLIHLGGQMFITAYNIEDNELWRRHILTALSQVTVALYVFGKSWSSSADPRLLAAAILLFIPGVLKCFEKPLALKAASFNSLVSSFHRAQKATPKSREEELDEFIRTAKAYFQGTGINNPPALDDDGVKLSVPHKLFADFSYPYSDRLVNLKYFLALADDAAYKEIETGLSNIFDLLYTRSKLSIRANALAICCCYWTWSLTVALAFVAIGLFHSSHKESYNHRDVAVTLVMLYGTLMLDIVSVLILQFAYGAKWPDVVAQCSLVRYFTHKKKFKMTAIGCCLQSCCNIVLIDQYCFNMDPSYLSKEITKLVLRHVRDGWAHYITDAESYKKFNDTMGQWTLERNGYDGILGWSLEKPFDEIVLVWHLATDFCFHSTSAKSSHPNIADYPSREMGRAISNYMMHLLFDNPEMLMAGSRKNLFMTAYDELERILRSVELQTVGNEEKLALKVMDKVRSKHIKNKIKSKRGFFVHDAWLLSEGLMGLGDDKEKMWDVIRDVWVEILCFSSGRCRGYLHAKSLGSGAEYLSFVWLLLAHAGMETFPERLHRRQKLRLLKLKDTRGQDGVDDDAPSATDFQGLDSHEEKKYPAAPAELNEIVVVRP